MTFFARCGASSWMDSDSLWNDLVAELEDGLERAERGDAVELLFLRGQFGVAHETRMELLRIVPLQAKGPALGETLGRPKIVRVLSESLGERVQFRLESDIGRVNRCRNVGHLERKMPGPGHSVKRVMRLDWRPDV